MSKITMLQTKIWLYVAVFGSTIIVALWLLQVVFFDAAYENRARAAVETAGKSVAAGYKGTALSAPYYSRYFKDDILVQVFNKSGLGQALGELDRSEPALTEIMQLIELLEEYDQKAEDMPYELVTLVEDKVQNQGPGGNQREEHIVYVSKVVDRQNAQWDFYICLSSTMVAVKGTQEVLRQQLFLVVVFFVLLSIMVSFFISSEIARPMLVLTQSAKLLAQGKYDVEFRTEDYTEINELANVLNYATKELAKTDRLKSQLMANVSHDLRTPLTMIKAYAEMIRDLSGDNPVKRNEHINVILEETDWMSALITDILEYSKISSGNMLYEMQPFDLTNLTVESALHFKDMMQENHVEIEMDCLESAIVLGDLKMMNRVIHNLMSNALNHSRDHSKVTISITRTERLPQEQVAFLEPNRQNHEVQLFDESVEDEEQIKKWKIRWQVRDSGPGIPAEKLEEIWSAYFSSGDTEKRITSGTGLGLSIVHGILTDHHAQFGVDSKVGEGTTFWFVL